MRRWKVESGITTMLSWSWPKPDVPLLSSTPMTLQLMRLTRISQTGRIAGAEEFTAHRLADDANAGTAAHLGFGEDAARRKVPVAGGEIAGVGAGDVGGDVFGGIDDADLLLCDGRNRLGVGHSFRQGGQVLLVETARRERGRAGAVRPCRANDQEVGAELGDVVAHLLRGARADGDHGNDCGNPDHDAEQGEKGAQHVAADRDQREADRLEQHHAISRLSASEATLPSRKPMVRWA